MNYTKICSGRKTLLFRRSLSGYLVHTGQNKPNHWSKRTRVWCEITHSRIRTLLTLLLVAAVGEEAGFVLGCRLVRLCSAGVEDPDGGSCRRSPSWRGAWVCCHERAACARPPRAHGGGSRRWVVCLSPQITW